MTCKDTLARLLATFSLLFLICACGGGGSSSPPSVTPSPAPAPTPMPDPAPTPAAETLPIATPGETPDNDFEGMVNVRFSVTVPDNTPAEDSLYVTGDFENWSGGGNSEYQLIQQEGNRYQLDLMLDAGSSIQFKFTRGSWSKEESSDLGRRVGNRIRTIRGDDIRFDEDVPGWIDLTPSGPNPYAGFWNTPTPDYSANSDRPVVNLVGDKVVYLNLGEQYQERGATAEDSQEGDLSSRIVIEGTVDTSVPGDYLLRYLVTDNNGNQALGHTRLVRVMDITTIPFSLRPVGQSLSHLGYAEQLPADYGRDPDKLYPLLIYHHGGGGDAASFNDSPFNSLNRLFSIGGGPATIAMQGGWNAESPLLVLSPQRSQLSPPDYDRINGFVDYAIHHYQVDPERIYMAGFSQGGLVSWQYAVDYPQKVAAIVPLASGFFRGIPANVCDGAVVPVWAFHSVDDNVISVNTGRRAVERMEECGAPATPRFTLFNGLGHQSHQYVLTLQGMGNALASDFPFDQNLYEWIMAQRVSDR